MATVTAESLSKKFRRRLIPAPPTLKERVVSYIRRGARAREEVFWALSGVSFEVEAGQMLGVIGSNGSGKSTLLKLLAGLYTPDGGSLFCEGKVTSLIELGAGFHPELTGRENILINGLLLGLSRREIRERFDRIVSYAGLEKFIDSPIRGYSSGMFMRLGFAIAAHVSPDILLIDEILAVGDEAFQHRCLGTIAEFRRGGGTIIYVSHDLQTVKRFCDRVLWLDQGAVRAFGEAEEVIDCYLEKVEEGEAARLMAEHHSLQVETLEGRGKRWGSREVSIESVKIRDGAGEERYLFHTGEAVSLEMSYLASVPVEDIVFGVSIHREDGVPCYGTNTQLDGFPLGEVSGRGGVFFRMDSLHLLEGTYFIDVAAHRRDGYPYDYHSRAYRIEIRSGVEEQGVCRIPHDWGVKPAGTPGKD